MFSKPMTPLHFTAKTVNLKLCVYFSKCFMDKASANISIDKEYHTNKDTLCSALKSQRYYAECTRPTTADFTVGNFYILKC